MPNVKIETPQNVPIEFPPAGLGLRLVAALIDGIVIVAYYFIIMELFGNYLINHLNGMELGALISLLFLPAITYSLWAEYFLHGRTLGKWIMKIKVIKIDGFTPGFLDYFIRWAFKLIDLWLITPLPGVLSIIFSKYYQRIGDLVAGTTVIKENKAYIPHQILLQIQEENYVPVFPSVILLSDKDIQIIREHYTRASVNPNARVMKALRNKIVEVIHQDAPEMNDRMFVRQVLEDYTRLTAEMDGAE